MTTLPTEALLGISFGLLVGVVGAVVVGVVGYVGTAYLDRSVPRALAVAIALLLAAPGAIALGALEPTPAHAPRALLGSFVVILLALYGNSRGQWLGESLPRDVALPTVRERTLSTDAAGSIDGTGHVTVQTSGEIRDVDGYPPLSPPVKQALRESSWQFPADLPIPELATRLEDRVRSHHDLAVVSASVDARGRATLAAAPRTAGVAARVPDGYRAVTVSSLVPSGLAPGDDVVVHTKSDAVAGSVLGVGAATSADGAGSAPPGADRVDDADPRAPVTVSVPTEEAAALMGPTPGRVVAVPRGVPQDFEAVSLLDRADATVRKILLTAEVRDAIESEDGAVDVLAVQSSAGDATTLDPGWTIAPSDDDVAAADVGFVAGATPVLDRLARRTGAAPSEVAP